MDSKEPRTAGGRPAQDRSPVVPYRNDPPHGEHAPYAQFPSLSVPTLETNRLILRELVESDAPAHEKHFANWEVVKTLAAGLPWPYPEGGVLNYIKTFVVPHQGKDKWVWAITLKEDPSELVGALDLWRSPNPSNRGFWLARHLRGQKLMSEAVVATTDFAFNQLGFEELHLSNATGNPASGRLKEEFGTVKVDVVRSAYVSSEFTHSERWVITKEAWRNYRCENRGSASIDETSKRPAEPT